MSPLAEALNLQDSKLSENRDRDVPLSRSENILLAITSAQISSILSEKSLNTKLKKTLDPRQSLHDFWDDGVGDCEAASEHEGKSNQTIVACHTEYKTLDPG